MRKSESLTVINPLPGTAISGREEIQTSTIDQLPYWMQSKLPQGNLFRRPERSADFG
jgi:hypothetical protein